MCVTRFHEAIWKQDFKILGKALSRSIHDKLCGRMSKIHNIEKPFPLYKYDQKRTNIVPNLQSKYVYYGEGVHDNSVVLLSYIKLPIF
ncbi:MAG TPA: hypothetical protein DHV44_07145 [Providencia sp.]|nr:hypothetical protein RB151_027090 [Providencia rettgeri]AVL75720.1 hypothetical protein CEQ08_19230 [Providencia rettgeri]RXN73261.1 hypothetical protein D0Z62_05420 [Providencia rettgeri]HCI96045.1 hypothetical protein [Providencia sp.]